MPSFNIVKKSSIKQTYRVSKIISDFDVKTEHSTEHFEGELNLDNEWNIGLIVGNSGTGKSTIAKEIFGNDYFVKHEYVSNSVIDDMPINVSMDEIEKMFYAVGFGSVPSWLKPYNVLSNGEKMRVDLAKALLEKDFVVFDEFTSVVDRNVATTLCIAINKALKKYPKKKFVAVTCHNDVIEWLQPNWVFDTNVMKQVFMNAHAHINNSTLENVGIMSGQNLENIII